MRKQLSKSEIKELNAELNRIYGVERLAGRDEKFFYVLNGERYIANETGAVFFYYGEMPVPTLRLLLKHNFLKKVVVDMGAVKFVANGADIMRPGIVSVDDGIKKDDVVVIVDQQHQKPIAVGIALFSSEEIRTAEKGAVIKNIHFVGDKIWNAR